MNYHFNWSVIWRNADQLLSGLGLALIIAVLALGAGCLIGMALALCRQSKSRLLRVPATCLVELLRNSPLLVLVFYVYFGLPAVGIRILNDFESFTLALAVYAGAYLCEIFRAGLASIPVAYIEAGKGIGLTSLQRLRYVVLPILFRIVLPSLSTAFISLFKDTSFAAAIGVHELTFEARTINVNTFQVIETWIVAAGLYLVTSYLIALLLRRVERRFAMVR